MTLSVLKPCISFVGTQICVQEWTVWQHWWKHRPVTGLMCRILFIFSVGGGLVWEGDGWLLLYKRLSESRFQWPRSPKEVRALTQQQFRWLMEGLTITPKKSVRTVEPPEYMG